MKLKKKKLLFSLGLIMLVFIIQGVYHRHKALPVGFDFSGNSYAVAQSQIDFLGDKTGVDPESGEAVHEQEIFDRVFSLIAEADDYILVDMFLFNDFMGGSGEAFRPLADELTEALIGKKQDYPEIKIDFITDPINHVYGGARNHLLEKLEAAGINVIITDLLPLRDSNPIYSSIWRTGPAWLGNSLSGWLPQPFSGVEPKVSLRSYLRMLNFKANHRKIIIANTPDGPKGIVASANPHNGSSAHSNVALEIGGGIIKELFASELAVAAMSGKNLSGTIAEVATSEGSLYVRFLTEKAIKRQIISSIQKTRKGDELKLAMFYLSDHDVVGEIAAAAKRGVGVKLILDPNKDAFGYEKIGIPNRQVASRLKKLDSPKLDLRWFDTHGEQFHAKMLIVNFADKTNHLILGSANFTKRNLENLNLEADVFVDASSDSRVVKEANGYFDSLWANESVMYTTDYTSYQDDSFFKKIIFALQEGWGLSSF